MLPFPVDPKVPQPSDSRVAAAGVAQYQTGSRPQPTVGAPNAVTVVGGTHSHTGDGSDAHNASPQPGR